MTLRYYLNGLLLLMTCLLLAGCKQVADTESGEEEVEPAVVEHLEGAEPTRITLTAQAAKRIDVQTAEVKSAEADGASQVIIPFDAVLYDTEGNTWTYINPKPLIFVRHGIVVDHIDGDQAVLSDGPPAGTAVVTVGAQELFGSESEFEEE
jgi:hypothetical protein